MDIPDPVNLETTRVQPIRVCYFGTYRANYVRNRLMIERLRDQGFEVIECHQRLWNGIDDRERVASGGWLEPAFWWRVISTYVQLFRLYRRVGSYDVMIVGYPGQPDMLLARLLSWLRRKPLVWDVLMSIYLITMERHLDRKDPIAAWIIRAMEGLACCLPDKLIIDTQEYANWFQTIHHVPAGKISLLPLGADDRVFKPTGLSNHSSGSFRCLYYGTFIPNHGVQVIIDAARLLSEERNICFELIGGGPQYNQMMTLSKDYGLKNISFTEWMETPALVKRIDAADIILGTFGVTPQALLTMQNKIHEGLAMGKPIINGISPVMCRTLQHGKTIYLCERENPQSLADAILTLRDNVELREKIARQGYAFYLQHLSFDQLGNRLKHIIFQIAGRTDGDNV
jgi:glycosyltransferase involved in cell wall biosynthesis